MSAHLEGRTLAGDGAKAKRAETVPTEQAAWEGELDRWNEACSR